MSLVDEASETCIMLDKVTESDGRGGVTTRWADGAEFEAAISFSSSNAAKIADALGEKSRYRVITGKNIVLQYHDVFKRLSDGKILRVTTDGDDNKTPNSASLNMRVVDAEEFTPAE